MSENMTLDEKRTFFDTVGTLGAGARVFEDGVQFVDDVKFWHWFTSNVTKAPYVNGTRIPLSDNEAIRTWALDRLREGLDSNKALYFQHMLQNRGAEFDFVRLNQHNPVEFLKGNLWRLATSEEDTQLGIDAVKHNLFTGENETHQIKAGLSDSFRRVDLK